MRGALLVLKKEFLELAKDRRTLFFTFGMPLILYPLLFGMLGRLGSHDAAARAGRPSRVCLADPGRVLAPALAGDAGHFQLVPKPAGDLRQAIRDQQLELAVEVDPDGPGHLERQEPVGVKALYDQSDDASRLALERFQDLLRRQQAGWVRARLARLGAPPALAEPVRLETVEAGDLGLTAGRMIGSFLPYLLMIMMYAGAMQHGIYATAGEKERGTLQSLLCTRLPRTQIIVGKLLYIFAIGILSAIVNLASMGLSVARLMAAVDPGGRGAAAAVQGQGQATSLAALATPQVLGLTFLLMVPLGLFFANFILLAGIRARNTLEASTSLTPGIFAVVLLGAFSMAPGIEKMGWLPYVPVLNVSLAIRKLFSQQADAVQYGVALAMTLGLAALMTAVSTRMLNRESSLFRL
jgi:sodium transport system permease protein